MDFIVQHLIYSLKEKEINKKNRILQKKSYILSLIAIACLTDKTIRMSDLLANINLCSWSTIISIKMI
jgi:hypothetical protein